MAGMDLMDILPRVVGAFYLVGGWLALRAVLGGDMLDRMLAALRAAARPSRKDAVRRWVLGTGALLTCLSGAALMLMSRWALPLFTANLLVQAGWLAWARTAFPPEDEEEAQGRRSVISAAVGYTAVTALVFWLHWRGRMAPLTDPVAAIVLGLAAAILGGWMIKHLSWDPMSVPDDWDDAPEPDEPELRPPSRLRLAPTVGDWVLWDADDGRGLDPFLYLPPDLAERITLWEGAYESDPADPLGPPRFQSLKAAQTHRQTGRAIADEIERIYGPGSVEGPVYPW